MFYPSSRSMPAQRRPGVVLLVVMAMLALFASLALSFVFYADSQAEQAGYSVAAQTRDIPEIDPEVLLGYFLSKFIYDDNDPYSAGRGWSLARTMYGNNPAVLNYTPYNGSGRKAQSYPITFGSTAVDNFTLINQQKFEGTATAADPLLGNLRVPEFTPGATITNVAWGGNVAAVTTSAPHGLSAGQAVLISGVAAPAYNGQFAVTTVGSTTTFQYALPSTVALAASTGGTVSRYVGGANPPWTAYDTNSLFLAQVDAAGNVLMPSFYRPWNKSAYSTFPAAVQTQLAKYVSMFPDSPANNPTATTWWNPAFALPDTDASGFQVKNLDFGPGMNDSNWMDWGFPIMTAPNGKRYKAMFAPLVVDMSNKLHLWAHGNNLGGTAALPAAAGAVAAPPGVSNMGLGSPEVNLKYLFGIPIAASTVPGAKENPGKGRVVTITTTRAHGLAVGQLVMIAGVALNGYDGFFTVTAVPSATTFRFTDAVGVTGLAVSGDGFVYTQAALAELQALYQIRYGPTGQAIDTSPSSVPVRPGTWLSYLDANGLSATTSLSSRPFFMPNAAVTTTTAIAGTPAGVARTVTLAAPAVDTTGQFPVYFFDVVGIGSTLVVGGETVTVTAVTPATNKFTAIFHQVHPAGISVVLNTPSAFPTFPISGGWDNANATDMANIPLAFNLFLPNGANTLPLPLSHQEAMLRWGGTNAPALTSALFQKMPLTFGDIRKRNMLTMANTYMDRVTSSPYLNYNRNSAQAQYGYIGTGYPSLGKTEVQKITVTGTAGTYTLGIPGRAGQTAAIRYNAAASGTAASVQTRLQTFLTNTGGGTVTVTALAPVPADPTKHIYSVAFSGTLSNLDVGQMTATPAGNPLPSVVVSTLSNGGQPLFLPVPSFGTPSSIVTTNSEFGTDARSTLAQLLRVDLSRPLRDYPAPNAAGLIGTTTAGSPFDLAQKDRQQFAADLYNALIRVTGARDPNVNTGANAMQSTAADYRAARWLAQLAVNIVDYIDNDDYCTPFNWNAVSAAASGGTIASEYLFGTELPRLVLNEAYAQQEPTTGTVNVWAELYNPFQATPATSAYPLDGGVAILQRTNAANANPPYKIEIHAKDVAFTTALNDPANSTGSVANPLTTQANWGTAATLATTHTVLPGNGLPKALVAKPVGTAAWVGGTATITTTGAHGLTAADVGRPIMVNVTGTGGAAYNGYFVVAQVPSTTTLKYALPVAAGSLASSSGGNITYGGNPNGPAYNQALGFYVIGPQGAPYGDPVRNPNVLATYLAPVAAGQGMSFASPTATIKPITAAAGTTGVTNNGAGNTVTVRVTAALPGVYAVGDQVALSGVRTTGNVLVPAYNSTYTIASIAANRLSFTFIVPAGTVLPAADSGSGVAVLPGAAPPAASVALVLPPLTLQLRRLANPHLALNNTVGATYNPYITVDSFDVPTINQSPSATGSFGRTQPYGAATVPAYSAAAVPAVGTANTFFSQNVANAKFNWLVHLDRPPVNPLELLHVSGYRPHELTANFVTASSGLPYGHYAPWNAFNLNTAATADPNALIYRALDQMSTHYMAGQSVGGRIQGNINLNTLTELEVWQALCDAHDSSTTQYPNPWFTQADVQTVLQKLITARNVAPGTALPVAINTALLPTSEGSPFKSFSAAATTASGNQVSLNDTWFRPDPTNPARPLFVPPSVAANANAHPYLQAALLQKIYNNITTTSNVFAVWWTVGFFEVVDESVKPARLGQEIGRAQNKHIRHRFFAIVDRSGLQLFNTTSGIALNPPAWGAQAYQQGQVVSYGGRFYTSVQAVSAGIAPTNTAYWTLGAGMNVTAPTWASTQSYIPGNIVANAAGTGAFCCIQANTGQTPTGLATDAYWQPMLQQGMLLEIDTGANAEVVAVQNATGMSFTAVFTKSHAAGVPIVCRGNPGPRATYNPHDDPGVVLHMTVIK